MAMGGVLTKPAYEYSEWIYSNTDHVLNWGVASKLAHDQSLFAQHAAKGYSGYVYAVTLESGKLAWCEEIWTMGRPIHTYISDDLEKLLLHATGEMGYG